MKRKGILSTENTERTEVGAVSSGRSVVNTEDLPDGFQMTELGPLPKEWRVVRLGEVVKLTKGRKPDELIPQYQFGALPYLTADYFRNRLPTEWVPAQYLSKLPLCSKEDVVLIWDGSKAGQVFIGLEGVLASTMVRIDPEKQIERHYLYYFLLTQFDLLNSKTTGTTIPHVNKEVFRNLPIPLPPLPEQRAIAHVLRTVQRAKEATEGVIAALKELKKSLMQHLFTYGPVPVTERERVPLQETEIGPIPAHWRVVRLGEVVEKTKQIDPRKKPEWFFKYVDVSSVDNELLRITSYQNFAGKEAPSRARKQIDAGDVLFATVRPYLKRIAIVPPELDGHICSTAFCVLRAKNEIDACYLFFAVAHEPFVQRVAEHQRGSSYPAVTDQDVLREVIPFPPLAAQREIARMLQAVDAKIAAEQARRAALEEVFKTLLHQLMTGKVRVKGFHLPELE
jgi:type I restriction enzyme S subunit